ncbi:TPA: O-antigen ligase family protein, partial [Streptococcus suis]|nr:O-antigen ligase family protein [Streptococcus suis]HEM5372503.1 O-antigen ligase family protein [Streptococcus suis]
VVTSMFVEINFERLFADFTAPIIWIIAIMYYNLYSFINIDYKKLKNSIFFSFLVLLGISALYIIQNGKDIVFLDRHLIGLDYLITGVKTRLVGFMNYPTLNTTTIIVSIPLIFALIKNKMQQFFFLCLAFIPIYLSGSRIGSLSLAILIICLLWRYIGGKFAWIKKLIVIFVILLIILNTELLYHEILAVYNSRESSNEARFIIYQESIDKVLENNILFGYGISEYSVTGTWLGSHSGYISFFYKSGIVGLILLMFSFFYVIKKSYGVNGETALFYFTSLAIFFIYETIDPIIIILVLFFSSIGIWNNINFKKDMETKNE